LAVDLFAAFAISGFLRGVCVNMARLRAWQPLIPLAVWQSTFGRALSHSMEDIYDSEVDCQATVKSWQSWQSLLEVSRFRRREKPNWKFIVLI
jgi:hypothetical protein